MNFTAWQNQVNKSLLSEFAISIDDAGIDDPDLVKAHSQGLSPEEYVSWFSEKYDLVSRREAADHFLKILSR
ncbi:MAG TPA: hypothetical protein VNR39_19920 [Pseudolabrys sp.]|nr:hypothetical protein [Pseudolabrys sp.]